MIVNKKFENFLKDNRISDEVWQKSECNWDLLQAIKEDYEKNISKFEDAATILVKEIQKISAVHSVRWRIKNTDHLLEKIIRKCADIERQEKYKTISVENYQEVVTDLVGIRALHLFKEDCFQIDKKLKETDYFSSIQKPVAYLREGDSFEKKLTEYGFEIEHHKAGYRSIHYLLPAPLKNCQFMVELQVRTIFEEGWSEIDHKIRYPNFSDNPLILHFLSIFNQIASNADEIGSFVLWLNNEENARSQNDKKIKAQENIFREQQNALSEKIQELENAFQEQENAFQEQEKTIHKLENTISSLQDK
ncbi:MAG: hypothetical protein PHQ03_06230, partial [Methylococcales bacterium]|nr:hypothetical protein [Methylococcales bacterium]